MNLGCAWNRLLIPGSAAYGSGCVQLTLCSMEVHKVDGAVCKDYFVGADMLVPQEHQVTDLEGPTDTVKVTDRKHRHAAHCVDNRLDTHSA